MNIIVCSSERVAQTIMKFDVKKRRSCFALYRTVLYARFYLNLYSANIFDKQGTLASVETWFGKHYTLKKAYYMTLSLIIQAILSP